MVNFSAFVHTFDLGEHIALWHSLRMKPVFLAKEVYKDLQNSRCDDNLKKELFEKKILLSYDGEDKDVLTWLREKVPQPDVSLGYFILSERCNLACKYCFVGSDTDNKDFATKDMTREVAEKAIDFFIRQLKLSDIDYTRNESNIIFFGGEPLINFVILEYVAQRIIELRNQCPELINTKLAVITNATLLSKERIKKLSDLGVAISISIDGFTEEANELRVDKQGNSTFDKVIAVLNQCRELSVVAPSLSVTLTEKTIKDLNSMVKLIKDYNIKGFGYNILLNKEDYKASEKYYEEASQFVIESFKALRSMGVYEDRIMRKLNSFAHSQIHFSDCGATAGGQLIFSPDGKVGICQGLLTEEENYATTVDDENFIAKDNPMWQKWASLSPINNDDCIECEALGICGGGCPINARLSNPEKGLNCINKRQCIHSKSTLKFLIEDLYNIAKEKRI